MESYSFGLLFKEAAWFILPAWIANGILTPFGYMKRMLGIPDTAFDFGKTLSDGARIVGDHVTWGGLLVAVVTGAVVGFFEGRPVLGALMGFGAFFGDAFGSFLKRRFRIPPGGFAPVLDHIDYILGSCALTALVSPVPLPLFLAVVFLTLVFHPLLCIAAHALGLKEVPW
jgi:CDP-2,3-bis-(O-geranylgeranyl)-sn-glycerol synthase